MGSHYPDSVLKLHEMAWPNDQNEEQKDPRADFCARCHPPDKTDNFTNHAINMS